MFQHVKHVHLVQKPLCNVHYVDNSDIYKNDLEGLYKKCFPEYSIPAKKRENIKCV